MGNGCGSDYSTHSQSRHSSAILGGSVYHWAVFPAVKGWESPVLKGSQSFLMVRGTSEQLAWYFGGAKAVWVLSPHAATPAPEKNHRRILFEQRREQVAPGDKKDSRKRGPDWGVRASNSCTRCLVT